MPHQVRCDFACYVKLDWGWLGAAPVRTMVQVEVICTCIKPENAWLAGHWLSAIAGIMKPHAIHVLVLVSQNHSSQTPFRHLPTSICNCKFRTCEGRWHRCFHCCWHRCVVAMEHAHMAGLVEQGKMGWVLMKWWAQGTNLYHHNGTSPSLRGAVDHEKTRTNLDETTWHNFFGAISLCGCLWNICGSLG